MGRGYKRKAVIPEPLTRDVTPGAESRARRADINKLTQKEIEQAAGMLTPNQFTLLNPEQQQWYLDATNKKTAQVESSSSSMFVSGGRAGMVKRGAELLYSGNTYSSGSSGSSGNKEPEKSFKEIATEGLKKIRGKGEKKVLRSPSNIEIKTGGVRDYYLSHEDYADIYRDGEFVDGYVLHSSGNPEKAAKAFINSSDNPSDYHIETSRTVFGDGSGHDNLIIYKGNKPIISIYKG